MDKKELFEKIESLPSNTSITTFRPYVDKKIVLGLISQLDEPQKVKIPSVVAHWIGYAKGWNKGLYYALSNASDEVLEWLCVDKLKRQEIFARAWLDGYEVEKEKRYLVRIIGINNYNSYLNYHKREDEWTIESEMETNAIRTKHTRKELEEAGFGWVFDCEGIEIEEVE